MGLSLAIAAPPLVALLVLLWALDRHLGRSGLVLLASILWGGLGATGLTTLVSVLWVEQPASYPYLIGPAVEELAKAALFVALVALGRVPSAWVGLAYGLACGLGFALWENAAYFERYGAAGPPVWLYMSRTVGAALLHGASTGVVGAAAGSGGLQLPRWRRALLLGGALALATAVHASWNYVCLVLADTSALRRALPASGTGLLLTLLLFWALAERRRLRLEMLTLWQDGIVGETLGRALSARRPVAALRKAGVRRPRRLLSAAMRLVALRRQIASTPADRRGVLEGARGVAEGLRATVAALARGERPPRRPLLRGRVALGFGVVASTILLQQVGHLSPVPAALARRTVVVASNLEARPEPLITVTRRGTNVLWQRGTEADREQVLTWVGPGPGRRRSEVLGTLPEGRDVWWDMTALGPGVVVGTRDGEALELRTFADGRELARARVEAPDGPEGVPCWPWISSDEGRTLLAWDRLRRAAWLVPSPLGTREPFDLPDPFGGVDSGDEGCFRGLMVTDRTAYEVARPGGGALVAAVDLEDRRATPLALCPARPRLRVHSLDKDSGQVLVLLGGAGADGYELWLARLDRAGRVLERCRRLRSMPSGEPSVVGLAGAGDDAFLAWATGSHVLLARIPLTEGSSRRARRWVLDAAPRAGPGVVRVGVIDDRLHVAWEGPSPGGRWSVKLLRTELGDLP